MLPLPFWQNVAVQGVQWAAISATLARRVCGSHVRACEAPVFTSLFGWLHAAVDSVAVSLQCGDLWRVPGAGPGRHPQGAMPADDAQRVPLGGPGGAAASAGLAAGSAVLAEGRFSCHVVAQMAAFHIGFVLPLVCGLVFEASLRKRYTRSTGHALPPLLDGVPWAALLLFGMTLVICSFGAAQAVAARL